MTDVTIAEALAVAGARLAVVQDSVLEASVLQDGALEAQLLLAELLGRDRGYLFAYPEARLSPLQQQRFEEWLSRRAEGEPLAYLSGQREFWSLPLRVTADTLIPRPETETLVEQCLLRIPAAARWRIADLGTGTGAIALALAKERPGCSVTASDCSAAALAIAADNAQRLGLNGLRFCQGDWCDALASRAGNGSGSDSDKFDLVVSNPPYIAEHDPHLGRGGLTYEPRGALTAGEDGLDALRRIIVQARAYLVAGGWLLLEHGYDQGDKVLDLLATTGYDSLRDISDLAGLPRVAVARNPGAAPLPEPIHAGQTRHPAAPPAGRKL